MDFLTLNVAYMEAQRSVLTISKRIAKLSAEGNHKLKNKIIHSDLMKATMKRNKIMQKLQDELNHQATCTDDRLIQLKKEAAERITLRMEKR